MRSCWLLCWCMLGGCVSAASDVSGGTSAAPTGVRAGSRVPDYSTCVIDGQPASLIRPPVDYCYSGEMPQALANGFRLYAREDYFGAIRILEPAVAVQPDESDLDWWSDMRFWLARSYVMVGNPRGERLLHEIVRTPTDPHRWAAAGWLCGGHPSNGDLPSGEWPSCEDPHLAE